MISLSRLKEMVEEEMENKIKDLELALKAKEQECEELKEAQKKSRCAWKSLEGTFCPEAQEQLDQLKKQNDIMLNSLKKLQNKICSNTSRCKYFLMDVLKEVENV